MKIPYFTNSNIQINLELLCDYKLVFRVGQFCRQYYWEQYIGPFFCKNPNIFIGIAIGCNSYFSVLLFVILLVLLVFKIRNIGMYLVNIWYCIGIVHFHALIKKGSN